MGLYMMHRVVQVFSKFSFGLYFRISEKGLCLFLQVRLLCFRVGLKRILKYPYLLSLQYLEICPSIELIIGMPARSTTSL